MSLVPFGHGYTHPGLLAAIPARYLNEIRAMDRIEQRDTLDKWYRWWVDSGLYLRVKPHGQLFGEAEVLPPWIRHNPPKGAQVSRVSTLQKSAKPFWKKIQACAAKSIGAPSRGFLGDLKDPDEILGCGFWGCVWRTADPRFVLKLTLDITEGPHVALAMDRFPLHPGVCYFHRIWKLPERVWTDEQGFTPLYVILREEVDVDSIWTTVKKGRRKVSAPARGYKKIYNALSELPECCSCLGEFTREEKRGYCTPAKVAGAKKRFDSLLKKVGKSEAKSAGVNVAKLLDHAYRKEGILLGDVHFGNVGLRAHNLSEWGVKKHKKLVVTDLGDLGQAPRSVGSYPTITRFNPGVRLLERYAQAIPVLPC